MELLFHLCGYEYSGRTVDNDCPPAVFFIESATKTFLSVPAMCSDTYPYHPPPRALYRFTFAS